MYSDRLNKSRGWILWLVLVLVLAALIGLFVARHPAAQMEDSSASAIRAAVQRSALQCYVVEGVYPPDLQYLQENYGLQVNTEDFYVTYDAFASNLPPTVRVTKK